MEQYGLISGIVIIIIQVFAEELKDGIEKVEIKVLRIKKLLNIII